VNGSIFKFKIIAPFLVIISGCHFGLSGACAVEDDIKSLVKKACAPGKVESSIHQDINILAQSNQRARVVELIINEVQKVGLNENSSILLQQILRMDYLYSYSVAKRIEREVSNFLKDIKRGEGHKLKYLDSVLKLLNSIPPTERNFIALCENVPNFGIPTHRYMKSIIRYSYHIDKFPQKSGAALRKILRHKISMEKKFDNRPGLHNLWLDFNQFTNFKIASERTKNMLLRIWRSEHENESKSFQLFLAYALASTSPMKDADIARILREVSRRPWISEGAKTVLLFELVRLGVAFDDEKNKAMKEILSWDRSMVSSAFSILQYQRRGYVAPQEIYAHLKNILKESMAHYLKSDQIEHAHLLCYNLIWYDMIYPEIASVLIERDEWLKHHGTISPPFIEYIIKAIGDQREKILLDHFIGILKRKNFKFFPARERIQHWIRDRKRPTRVFPDVSPLYWTRELDLFESQRTFTATA